MKIVHHIRQQPHHIREIATVLCTIVVAGVIGVIWLSSFKHEMYSLLNPSESTSQDRQFAQQSKSIFASLYQVMQDGRAQISGLFSHSQTEITTQNSDQQETAPVAHPLPVNQ